MLAVSLLASAVVLHFGWKSELFVCLQFVVGLLT